MPGLEHDEALPLMVRRLLTDAQPHLARLDEAIAACEVAAAAVLATVSDAL